MLSLILRLVLGPVAGAYTPPEPPAEGGGLDFSNDQNSGLGHYMGVY